MSRSRIERLEKKAPVADFARFIDAFRYLSPEQRRAYFILAKHESHVPPTNEQRNLASRVAHLDDAQMIAFVRAFGKRWQARLAVHMRSCARCVP